MPWYLEGFSKENESMVLNQAVPGLEDAEVVRLLSPPAGEDYRIGVHPIEGDVVRAIARLAGHEVRDDLIYFVGFNPNLF
jgi:hypothetical protein